VSQTALSLVEGGHFDQMPLRRVRQVARALGAELQVTVRWRGGDLDRLMDEGHAALAGAVTRWLERRGWVVRSEVTYSVYGERGSIDLMAWHGATRTLLVVEIKTELTSIEETLRRHDAKTRLASGIASEGQGWRPNGVARLLVLPNAPTARRRVSRHEPVLGRAYPLRSTGVRDWVRAPHGAPSGLVFVSTERHGRVVTRKRVRPC